MKARTDSAISRNKGDILSGIGAVVHEQKLDVLGVVDKEGLVSGRHHVPCLLVAAIADLSNSTISVFGQSTQR